MTPLNPPPNKQHIAQPTDRNISLVIVIYLLFAAGMVTFFVSAIVGFIVAIYYRSNVADGYLQSQLDGQIGLFLKTMAGLIFGICFALLSPLMLGKLVSQEVSENLMLVGIAVLALSVVYLSIKSAKGIVNINAESDFDPAMKFSRKPEDPSQTSTTTADYPTPNDDAQDDENAEKLSSDADELLIIIDEYYEYGDPTYEPGVIIIEAKRQLGFSESYVEDLVHNLDKRKQVKLQYNHGISSHPAEMFDYWRLQRGRKHKVVKALRKAEKAKAASRQ